MCTIFIYSQLARNTVFVVLVVHHFYCVADTRLQGIWPAGHLTHMDSRMFTDFICLLMANDKVFEVYVVKNFYYMADTRGPHLPVSH